MQNATYAIASGLVGFRSSTFRVRVTEQRNGVAWVMTADLLDAGTRLVLDASQVSPEPHSMPVFRHRHGLVAFTG